MKKWKIIQESGSREVKILDEDGVDLCSLIPVRSIAWEYTAGDLPRAKIEVVLVGIEVTGRAL